MAAAPLLLYWYISCTYTLQPCRRTSHLKCNLCFSLLARIGWCCVAWCNNTIRMQTSNLLLNKNILNLSTERWSWSLLLLLQIRDTYEDDSFYLSGTSDWMCFVHSFSNDPILTLGARENQTMHSLSILTMNRTINKVPNRIMIQSYMSFQCKISLTNMDKQSLSSKDCQCKQVTKGK